MIKSVTILGGGTSGLIAALVLKSAYNKLDITLIKSSSIGIIGVGEGSTEHWSQFMNFVGLNVNDLVLHTGATYKTGIKFKNWNGDGKHYYHSIHDNYLLPNKVDLAYRYAYMIAQGKSALELVPDHIQNSLHAEPFEHSVYQFHFHTHKLNDYLLNQCKIRGIKIVDTVIKDVILDENGYVECLVDENNYKHYSEFFVDSSGMKRIIANKLGAKWIDCSEFLPMNSAIAFPTERTEDIPSHTESNAMSSGWMWRIPTQDRYGNGYVFNNNFITVDQAVAEAQTVFDKPIEIGKHINFTAGYVDRFWIKNCVSLGLSGSFVEPLEASSIGTSIQQSIGLAGQIFHYEKGNETTAKIYNEEFEEVAKNIIDFVQLHYVTKRKDSDFWKDMKHLKLTEFNLENIERFQRTLPQVASFAKPFLMFKDQNWLQVMHGLELFDSQAINSLISLQNDDILYDCSVFDNQIKNIFKSLKLVSHREAIEILKSRKPVEVVSVNNE